MRAVLLAEGANHADIMAGHLSLKAEDILAAIHYAAPLRTQILWGPRLRTVGLSFGKRVRFAFPTEASTQEIDLRLPDGGLYCARATHS